MPLRLIEALLIFMWLSTCPACLGLAEIFHVGNKGRTLLELSNAQICSHGLALLSHLFQYPSPLSPYWSSALSYWSPDYNSPFPDVIPGLCTFFGLWHLNSVLFFVYWHLPLLSWEYIEVSGRQWVFRNYGMRIVCPFFFFLKKIVFIYLGERMNKRAWAGGEADGEREADSPLSKDPRTWAEGRCLTDWATQVPQGSCILFQW